MSEDNSGEEVKQRGIMFYVQGNNFIIKPQNVTKIIKDHYIDSNETIFYTINIYENFGEMTTIKFLDEDVRDKEHLNLISKFDEYGVDIV